MSDWPWASLVSWAHFTMRTLMEHDGVLLKTVRQSASSSRLQAEDRTKIINCLDPSAHAPTTRQTNLSLSLQIVMVRRESQAILINPLPPPAFPAHPGCVFGLPGRLWMLLVDHHFSPATYISEVLSTKGVACIGCICCSLQEG